MPKGHSAGHYKNLSFLQLLVSCSVVKFNLRRVNRIFPPNASLLPVINLLLSTKRALLPNEIEDRLKTSGKQRELLWRITSFLLADMCKCVCVCARTKVLNAWAGILSFVKLLLLQEALTFLTTVDSCTVFSDFLYENSFRNMFSIRELWLH